MVTGFIAHPAVRADHGDRHAARCGTSGRWPAARTRRRRAGRSKRDLGVVAGLQRAVGIVDLQLDQQGAGLGADRVGGAWPASAVKVRPGYSGTVKLAVMPGLISAE